MCVVCEIIIGNKFVLGIFCDDLKWEIPIFTGF